MCHEITASSLTVQPLVHWLLMFFSLLLSKAPLLKQRISEQFPLSFAHSYGLKEKGIDLSPWISLDTFPCLPFEFSGVGFQTLCCQRR